jgi:small-conductance mechanosensitive channel
MSIPIRAFLAVFLLLIARPSLAATADVADSPSSPTAPQGLSSAQAQQLLDVLQDPAKRAMVITTLENLQKVVPVAAVTTTPAAAAKPAAPPPAKAPSLKADGLGAELLDQASSASADTGAMLARTAKEITDFPALGAWVVSVARDPAKLRTAGRAAVPLVVIFLLGFLLEWFTVHFTRRFYDFLGGHQAHASAEAAEEPEAPAEVPPGPEAEPEARRRRLRAGWLLLRRLPFILLALAVDLTGPLVFLATALLVLATPLSGGETTRLLVLGAVGIYARGRVAYCVIRALIAAPAFRLRLLHVPDAGAAFVRRWTRRIVALIVCGYILGRIALYLGLSPFLENGFIHMIALVVHLLLIWAIIECRAPVALWIAGTGDEMTSWARLRRRYAPFWHIHAMIVVVAVWIIAATSDYDGTARPVQFVMMSLLILVLARIVWIVLLGGFDRLFPGIRATETASVVRLRVAHYHRPVRVALQTLIVIATLLALFQVWGLGALSWLTHDRIGSQLLRLILNLAVTLVIAVGLWEVLNVGMQAQLDGLTRRGDYLRAARLRTIVPLLRNALFIVLVILIGLTALSELGVNIAPLLAGAGIFGVALGFGSQKLVQDFITGIFLLIENAMQVGDNVTAGGLSGTVENLSIRTLRLRAGDGSVHLIPFSAVSTVTNSNRGIGNAAVAVTVDYEEDTDRVGALLSRVAKEMRDDEKYASGMLSDLQLWGVDKVDGTTVTLAGQIVCTDGARWSVQREYNRRIKLAFQEEGIRMTPPVTVSGFRHPLDIRVERPPAAAAPAGDAPEAPKDHN